MWVQVSVVFLNHDLGNLCLDNTVNYVWKYLNTITNAPHRGKYIYKYFQMEVHLFHLLYSYMHE